MYGKFFKSAFSGSMCGAGADVFAVWAYVIAHKFKSTVELNPRVISFTIGMTPERAQAAIDYLCAPDPDSRNTAEDGRRLVKEGPFQYFVVSGDIYDAIQNEELRREQWRDSQRKGREKKKNASSEINGLGEMSTDVNSGQQGSTHIEVKVKEEEEEEQKPTPRKSVSVIPEWIPRDSWIGFVEMRKKIRAPLTDRAIAETIRDLEKLAKLGHDPGAVLDQSTRRSWRGIFPLKQPAITNTRKNWTPDEIRPSPAVARQRASDDAIEKAAQALETSDCLDESNTGELPSTGTDPRNSHALVRRLV